jgi:mono/diheme cytochrome c family protein
MKKILGLMMVAAVLVLVAYHVLVYYDNNFRSGRMRETPAVKPHEEPILIMEAGLVPTTGGEITYRLTAGEDLTPPIPMTAGKTVDRGKSVYFTYCAQCHGSNHAGNGTVGQSFHPLPTDLRSPEVQSKKYGELFKTVSYGIPGGRQPPLQTTITIDGRWSVVAYVKALGLRD